MVLGLAARYFGWVFAAGMVLGTARALWLEPLWGPVPAVLVELPVMIGLSALACRGVMRGQRMTSAQAVAMGALALAFLLVAEAVLSMTLGGLSLAEHLALYGQAASQLGLAGQVVFAALPVLMRRRAGRLGA